VPKQGGEPYQNASWTIGGKKSCLYQLRVVARIEEDTKHEEGGVPSIDGFTVTFKKPGIARVGGRRTGAGRNRKN